MKKIYAVNLRVVADKNGDIEIILPRPIPMLRDTLGIVERAESVRRAMASPLNRSPSLPPAPLADFDDLSVMPAWAKWIYLISAGLVVAGIGMLVWASV